MPINDHHRQFIETSLDHLLEFDPEEGDFSETVEKLKTAFTLGDDVDENHEFYHLQRALKHPASTLTQLERQSVGPIIDEIQADGSIKAVQTYTPITLGEVQSAVIALVRTKLKAAARLSAISFRSLGWQSPSIPVANFNTAFTTDVRPIDSWQNPLQLPPLDGVIYTRNLRQGIQTLVHRMGSDDLLQETLNRVFLDVSINLAPGLAPRLSSIVLIPTIPIFSAVNEMENDQRTDAYLTAHHSLAEKLACKTAAKTAYHYLEQLFNPDHDNRDYYSEDEDEDEIENAHNEDAAYTPAFCQFITLQYYYDQIRTGQISLEFVNNLNESELENLSDPTIISLLQRSALTLARAKQLDEPARRVLMQPFYNSLFIERRLRTNSLFMLDKLSAHFLTSPRTIFFIRSNRFTLETAFIMPRHLQAIIVNGSNFSTAEVDQASVDWYADRLKQILLDDPMYLNGEFDYIDAIKDELPLAAHLGDNSVNALQTLILDKTCLGLSLLIPPLPSRERNDTRLHVLDQITHTLSLPRHHWAAVLGGLLHELSRQQPRMGFFEPSQSKRRRSENSLLLQEATEALRKKLNSLHEFSVPLQMDARPPSPAQSSSSSTATLLQRNYLNSLFPGGRSGLSRSDSSAMPPPRRKNQ